MPFFKQKLNYLGIDIGTSSIKVVEIANDKGKPRLVTYGFTEKEPEDVKLSSRESQEKTAEIIKKICQEAKTTATKTLAALPTFSVFTSILTLPEMPAKELELAVKREAKKIVPLPLEEMILDYKEIKKSKKSLPIVSQLKNAVSSDNGEEKEEKDTEENEAEPGVTKIEEKAAKTMKIYLTAAPKKLVNNYMNIFKLCGLSLLSLETESFSLVRSLVGDDPSTILIVDIGATTTNIIIVDDGIAALNRTIDAGGLSITNALAESLNMSVERAEQFKQDLGVKTAGESNKAPELIKKNLQPIIDEIKHAFQLYASQSNNKVEKIILTGGSAMLPGISEYFEENFNIKAFVGDPWARVIYPEELRPVLDQIGARFSIAIGLAVRDIE